MGENGEQRKSELELTEEEQEAILRKIETRPTTRWPAMIDVVGRSRAERIIGAEQARAIAERAEANTEVEDAAAEARAERFRQAPHGSQGLAAAEEAPKDDS